MAYNQPGTYGQQSGYGMANTSGQGENAIVPAEAQGLNWGAFFFTWIWAIVNNAGVLWIVIGFFLSFLSPIPQIIFLIKGNELAWKGKQWASAEAFKATQRKWAMAGLILFAAVIVLACVGGGLGALLGAANSGN